MLKDYKSFARKLQPTAPASNIIAGYYSWISGLIKSREIFYNCKINNFPDFPQTFLETARHKFYCIGTYISGSNKSVKLAYLYIFEIVVPINTYVFTCSSVLPLHVSESSIQRQYCQMWWKPDKPEHKHIFLIS